jgi:dTDP-4-dehydrorhamnose reductase
MKLLILGGHGMIGHVMVKYFTKCTDYNVSFTTRDKRNAQGLYLEARDSVLVEKIIEAVSPNVIINCIGLLNDNAAKNKLDAYRINGLFPHELRRIADRIGSTLIHISTDCVFSGARGDYTEKDRPNGTSIYARTKALGEVIHEKHLTIRTSIIGPEIRGHGNRLLHWFLQQQGIVKGYKNVIWNGLTTIELAKAVHYIIEHPVGGLLHLVSPHKISKLELLQLFKQTFSIQDIILEPDGKIIMDRTLLNTRNDFHYETPGYLQQMIELLNWMSSPIQLNWEWRL